jgi:CDP-6-deoxy-D-xylo-4-hexulose-3-dehydrase
MIKVGDYFTTPEDEQSVLEVLRSNRLSEGSKVREFEEKWAEFCGTKYCVLTNSGTSALLACLEVMKDITKQRKVWTSPNTFISTVNAIVLSGFEPVFSDVDKETFVLKPILNRAGIFLPVHLYGYPVDMNEFNYSWMIEDACEAHGSLYKGKKVGSIGLMGCFSFYIAHNIQVGDMGAIITNDLEIYRELKKVKAHGRMCECTVCHRAEGKCPNKDKGFDPRFTHTRIAYNFKTTEMQAALGLNQLKHADEIIRKRQENVLYLNTGLRDIKDLQLPIWNTTVSYLAYPLILRNPEINRNEFCNKIEKAGVETRPFFSCVPTQQPAYAYLREQWKDKLPNAEWLGLRGFHIGCHQYLTKEELDFIIETVRKEIIYDSRKY